MARGVQHQPAQVVLIHPMQLTAEQRSHWTELFVDYEIVQPFPQLARDVFTLKEPEQASHQCDRFNGKRVTAADLAGLKKRGWQPWEDAQIDAFAIIADGQRIILSFEPGGHPSELFHEIEAQALTTLEADQWPNPVAMSEVLNDINQMILASAS